MCCSNFPGLASGTPSNWLLWCPFTTSQSFLECFLALCDSYVLGSFYIFPASALESTISPRSLSSFYRRRKNVCFPVKDVITETASSEERSRPSSHRFSRQIHIRANGPSSHPIAWGQCRQVVFLIWKAGGWGSGAQSDKSAITLYATAQKKIAFSTLPF